MFAKFKSCKSSSKNDVNMSKSKSKPKLIKFRDALKDINQVNEIKCINKRNKNLTSTTESQCEKENIYYTPIVSASTQNKNYFGLRNSSTKSKRTIDFFRTQRQKAQSSESFTSCLSLKKNHLKLKSKESRKMTQNPQQQNIYQSYDFVTSSCKEIKKPNIKQLSTKTSIKQIQLQHNSPYKKSHKQQLKQSTLQIAMKNMLSQLNHARKENIQLKNQLIQQRSQQFYVLDRQKVKQMVIELQKQKEIRVKVQKENLNLIKENQKLKESYSQVKKQNIRFKRINADMKRIMKDLNQQNKVLRERKWVKLQKSNRQKDCDSNDSDEEY